jgi:opacity protein-like surface antigen
MKMINFLIGVGIACLCALSLLASDAYSADLPAKTRPPAPAAVADWTGFYVGIHGGYGWGKIKPDDFDVAAFSDDAFGNPEPKGWVFGGHAGYNWQYGRLVGGLELDYSATGVKDAQTATWDVVNADDVRVGTLTWDLASKIDALGSVRGRAGFLLTDNLLAYGTGGVGWAHSKVDFTATACDLRPVCESQALAARTNHFGWVAGGGIEYRLAQNLLLRGEYLHYDFGSVGYAFQPLVTINAKTTVDVARGGVSLRF